nr:phosphatidate cytidylyltransferase, mitochondrial-like [Coffea arabica]
MIDCIIGVSDPEKWHSENLKMNRNHYASWLVHFGGARLIAGVADDIGVGVHFNPFVSLNDKMYKYGVVRMDDLINDILGWQRFYLCGRLQKPVNIIMDSLDLENLNHINLRAATSAALLLLPSKFTEEDLYAKICSLSYMGDLRMLFAEDKNKAGVHLFLWLSWRSGLCPPPFLKFSKFLKKCQRTMPKAPPSKVKKIVQGQFSLFHRMYNPFLEEYAAKDLLRLSSSGDAQVTISQDCGSSAASKLVSSLPPPIRSQMGIKLGEKKILDELGRVKQEVVIGSKEEAAQCMQKLLRNKVMISSARQAVAGLLTVGVFGGARYVSKKMQKAWKS